MSDPYDRARDENASVLGPTLQFKGELSADEDLLILGRVEGTIRHSSSLTIGESGHVKADVSAEYIAVDGRVEGDLRGGVSIKIRQTANVAGNVVSPNVSLVEGAKLNGKIDMESDPAARPAQKPAKVRGGESTGKQQSAAAEIPPAESKPDQADKKSADAA